MMWYTKCGGRKFLQSSFVLVSGFVALVMNVLPAVQFVALATLVLGLYQYNNNKTKELNLKGTDSFIDDK
jgi:hypothetical protein